MNESANTQSDVSKVKDIQFSDLYLGVHESWMGGVGESKKDPILAPDSVSEDLGHLRLACEEAETRTGLKDFSIKYDDVAYRASKMPSLGGTVFVLRRFPGHIPELDKLGIHPGFLRKLMRPGLTGMIAIAGPTGGGKTTTASSLVRARLQEFGGVAITAEDPPEMTLEGVHGNGICYQTVVSRDNGGFGEASRQIMRWNPDIIFLGEIRDESAAIEALRASINGHLVITTIHSDSVITAIHRLHALASSIDSSTSSSLLADGLLAVLHQRLEGEPKSLKTEFLFLDNEDNKGAKSIIRDRKFEQLTSEIQAQVNRMLMEDRMMKNAPAMAR